MATEMTREMKADALEFLERVLTLAHTELRDRLNKKSTAAVLPPADYAKLTRVVTELGELQDKVETYHAAAVD